MLSPRERLRRSADFTLTVRRGRRAGRGALVVHLYRRAGDARAAAPFTHVAAHRGLGDGDPNPRAESATVSDSMAADRAHPARVGFIVPRAVGNAVVRNRVKRRLRHLVRHRLGSLPCGTLVVVRALPRAAGASYADLAADFDAASARVLGASQGEAGRAPGDVE